MKILSNNKKAFYDYIILEKFEAGIELFGSEVKSIKEGRANLKDGFCRIQKNEVFMYNTHVSPYVNASIFNHAPERVRKLLMHKREIIKLNNKIKEGGLTLVPTKIYSNEKGLIKVEICLAKGKKSYDKRDALAKKDFQKKLNKKVKYDNL
ncbi:MAG TPA: SsrA-binding protein SmpB [Tepiditoga sp.]|nr:SsrA-binding protein SmpB [Thermotogota bacterium]HOO74786.1 SsrA-binding protein SmpB [Tepiditoga sp.]